MHTKSIILASTVIAGILFSGGAMAQASSVEFQGYVPSGPSATAYHDKTYTFSYCDDSECPTHKSLGTITENTNGIAANPLSATMSNVGSEVTIFVSVINGSPATKTTEDDITGSYYSTAKYTPTNGKLSVNFDATSRDWTKVS